MEGVAVVGATLEAKVTPEKATVTYKWMRADAEDGEYVAIAGATDKTYTLSEADAGKWIKVEVKGTGNYTGTKIKVVGPVEEVEEPESETGIEGLDADGKRIGFFETVAEALADSDVDTIVLTGEVEGFKVDRDVTIKGGTINSTTIPATSGNIGIYVPANVTGVVFDGVKILGTEGAKIGIEVGTNAELTVKDSEISNFTTGIYLNPGSVLKMCIRDRNRPVLRLRFQRNLSVYRLHQDLLCQFLTLDYHKLLHLFRNFQKCLPHLI